MCIAILDIIYTNYNIYSIECLSASLCHNSIFIFSTAFSLACVPLPDFYSMSKQLLHINCILLHTVIELLHGARA